MWSDLLNYIAARITTNGNNEITGAIHSEALTEVINKVYGAGFQGVATAEGSPTLQGDSPLFWIANKGTYTNYGGLVIEKDFAIILYRGAFTKHELDIGAIPLIETTQATVEPPATGGTENLNRFVKHNDIPYFVDKEGRGMRLGTKATTYVIASGQESSLTIGTTSNNIEISVRGQIVRIVETPSKAQEIGKVGNVITPPPSRLWRIGDVITVKEF